MGFGMFSFHSPNCLLLWEDLGRAEVPCGASLRAALGCRSGSIPARHEPRGWSEGWSCTILHLLLCPVAEAASRPTGVLSPRSGSNSLGPAAHPSSSSGMNIDGAAGCGGKTQANLIRVTGAGLPGGTALPFPDINVTVCHKAFFNVACQ